MKCTSCGFQNSDSGKFCSECGQPLAKICPSCGHPQENVNSKFCSECGYNFKSESTPQKSKIEVEEKLKGNIGTGRKQATVFFADIKGSTSLTEGLDPEDSRKLLNPGLTAMLEAVRKYGGTVIKTAGDGIVAVFGAPIAYEDHALRACYAGLHLQNTIIKIHPDFSVRIGMNSGEIVFDIVDSDLRKEFDVMGPVVALAARMEQLAGPNMVQLSPDTFRLVKDSVRAKSRGKLEVKGFSEPIETFELLGIKQNFTRFLQMKSSHLSKFVGSKQYMPTLEKAVIDVKNEMGRVIGIVGEPGQGKSRLVYEFMNGPSVKDYIQYSCQCQEILRNNPLFSMKQVLHSIFEFDDMTKSNPLPTVEEKLKTLEIDVQHFRNVCSAILDIPIKDPNWNALAPEFRRQEIINGFVKLFVAINSKQPTILLIEDVQWVDEDTLECIQKLADQIVDKKILLLLTFRPEFKANSIHKQNVIQITLLPLKEEDFYELASTILGSNPSLEELKPNLVKRCNGNPFFLEEMIQSLKDHQVLGGEYQNYFLQREVSEIQLPMNVRTVLDSRVDLLSTGEKWLLRICAVVGKNIPYNLLKMAFDISDEELNKLLNTLTTKNFISRTQEYPEVIFTFNHDLIIESVYNSILKGQRKEMHLSILEALEKNFQTVNLELLALKASHAFKGELWEKAVNYYSILQANAQERTSCLESLEYADKVFESYNHLTNPLKEHSLQYLHTAYHMCHVLYWLGRGHEVMKFVPEVHEVVKSLNDPIIEAESYIALLAIGYIASGEYEIAKECCEKGLKILEEEAKNSGSANNQLILLEKFTILHIFYCLGNFKEVITYANEISDHIAKTKDEIAGAPLLAATLWAHIAALAQIGEFAQAKEVEKYTLGILQNQTPSLNMYHEQCGLSRKYCYEGDFVNGLKFVDLSLETSSRMNITMLNPELLAMKGYILSFENKPDAKKYLDMSYQLATERKFFFFASFGVDFLCKGYLNLNMIESAKLAMNKLFELGEKRKQKAHEVYAWRLKAEIELIENSPHVVQTFIKAMSLAEENGMLPEIAHSYSGLFQYYKKMGDSEKANEFYKKAENTYQKLGMQFKPEQAMLNHVKSLA